MTSRRPASRRALSALVLAAILTACRGPAPSPDRLIQDLPLLEFPTDRGTALAVFLSGDGGWAELPREVGARLAAAGVAVVGLDSRRYLESGGSASATAADIGRVMEAYSHQWHRTEIVLVGFSRGANLAAFVDPSRWDISGASLKAIVLLAPGTHEKFRFRMRDLLRTTADSSGTSVVDRVRRLSPRSVVCLSGVDERVPTCEQLVGVPSVDARLVPGGHHLDRDYTMLAELILRPLSADQPTGATADQRGDVPDDPR